MPIFMSYNKKCGLCNLIKPYELFYKDKSKPLELSTYCKECSKVKANKRYVKIGRPVLSDEERNARKNTSKKKYRDENRGKLRLAAKTYNNSPEGKARGKAWRESNSDEILLYRKSYYEEKAEIISKKSSAYYRENDESIKLRVRNRSINEREKVNAEKAAYKAWRRTEEKLLSYKERKSITAFYKYARKIGCEVDHIIPREKKGRHCLGNLQAISPALNQKKHTKIGRFTENAQGICCIPFFEGIKQEHLLKILFI
jgi:hypothetical protein